jgi:succinyl-CoA synthetase beta subunit
MKLLEHKAKEVLSKYGIPIPRGVVASDADMVRDFPYPAAIKALVPIGGRGKAGGVKFAEDSEQAREFFNQIIGMDIRGYEVKQVLVEEMVESEKELYFSFTIDRKEGTTLMMLSGEGGIEVESVPDEKIIKTHISPLIGVQPFALENLTTSLNLTEKEAEVFTGILNIAYQAYEKEDAELVEINPLVITKDGEFVALDAKVTIDDNALARHPEYQDMPQDISDLERKAKKKGIAFVQLSGDIGVIANGAGLTMATLDVLNAKGGKGGVFLDLGGTDDAERVKEAFYLMQMAEPSVILLNIFGGITKCDTVALGVKEAMEEGKIEIPVVARIKGLHEKRAKDILKDAGVIPTDTISEAAAEAVRLGGS